jgi:N-glycosylase/DNA lyase
VVPGGKPVAAAVRAEGKRSLRVEWHGGGDLAAARRVLLSVLRADEDLRPLHRLAAADPSRRWIAAHRAGRLLRAPTAFEDLVKLVLTTNCSWAFTKKMAGALVDAAGEPAPLGLKTFPAPAALAGRGARFFRDRVRAGYRAPFLADLVRRVNSGAIDPESWRTSALSTEALRAAVLEAPGAGPYVAENFLKLVGRYDYLALDSWCRARYAEIFCRGRRAGDAAIARRYRALGPWRGIVLWLDLTREWHVEPRDPLWS